MEVKITGLDEELDFHTSLALTSQVDSALLKENNIFKQALHIMKLKNEETHLKFEDDHNEFKITLDNERERFKEKEVLRITRFWC